MKAISTKRKARPRLAKKSATRQRGGASAARAGAEREQRQQDQREGGERALHQRRRQDDEAPLHQRQAALRAERQQLGQGRPLEGVEEEGAVVGRRRERELVARVEALRVGAEDGDERRDGIRASARRLWRLASPAASPGMPDQVERIVFGEGAQACDPARVEGACAYDECRGLPAPDHGEPRGRIGDAARLQRLPARSRAA